MALIPSLLGATFDELPATVRRIHDGSPLTTAEGFAAAERARGFWPWLICTVAGLPISSPEMSVTVTFASDDRGREQWRRRFGSRCYASTLAPGGWHDEIAEYFGPFTLFQRVSVQSNGLRWTVVAWRFLGIPLPNWSTPSTNAIESEDGGRFIFDISVAFPLVGHVISYRGSLAVNSR